MKTHPTISTVFVLEPRDPGSLPIKEPHVALGSAFFQMLPQLNYTSTCYLVGRDRPGDAVFFGQAFEAIKRFLEEHAFLQISLRPVHTLSANTTDTWRKLYLRFLKLNQPFQEEGYRQQIVSRLRLFPVLFFPDHNALEAAQSFLRELHRNFLLPSILLPQTLASLVEPLLTKEISPAWERIYLMDAARFDPGKALEALQANTLVDTLLDREASPGSPQEPPLCREILILDDQGQARNCLHSRDAQEDAPGCGGCIQEILHQTETSFRLNQRLDTWREACESTATAFKKRGRNEDALRLIERCMRGYPEDATPTHLRVQKALLLYEKGDLEGAMPELEKSLKAEPDSPAIRYYMGLCEFGWKDYIEAADRFREAVDMGLSGPMKQEAEYFRGESHCHLEEYEEALQALIAAEEAGKLDSPLCFYKGLGLLGTGKPKEARIELKKALSLGPAPGDLFHVLFYIAHACKEAEIYAEAVDYCRQALNVEAASQEAYNLMGFCHFKQKQYDDAIICFEKAIEIDPTSAIDYANIGSNLREKGDLEGAMAMYRKALSMDPNITFALESLERLEKKQG